MFADEQNFKLKLGMKNDITFTFMLLHHITFELNIRSIFSDIFLCNFNFGTDLGVVYYEMRCVYSANIFYKYLMVIDV